MKFINAAFLFFPLFFLTVALKAQESSESLLNAQIFIDNYVQLSDSGGAGNGGNSLVSEFFQEALMGINELAFTLKITEEQKKAIIHSMKTAKVFPVEFQLCEKTDDNTCGDEKAYVAKNYPNYNLILIDARNSLNKWKNLGIKMKRRIAAHEFAGLAGIEISNHFFSSQIDDERVYRQYKDKNDLKRYFSLLNDLYYLLPKAPSYYFAGEWGKTTVIRPGSMRYSQLFNEVIKGAKYHIQFSLYENSFGVNDKYLNQETGEIKIQSNWSEPQSSKYVILQDKTSTDAKLMEDDILFDGCSYEGQLVNSEFRCQNPDEYKPQKWNGKFKKHFAPSFPISTEENVSRFSCKPINENEIICRHTYFKKRFPSFLGWSQIYEYSFYKRLTKNQKFFNSTRNRSNSCEYKIASFLSSIEGRDQNISALAVFLPSLAFGPWIGLGTGVAHAIYVVAKQVPVETTYKAINESYVCSGKNLDKLYTKFLAASENKSSKSISKDEFCLLIQKSNEDGSLCKDIKRVSLNKIVKNLIN